MEFSLLVSCPSATFALQHGGLIPREWLAAKGLLTAKILFLFGVKRGNIKPSAIRRKFLDTIFYVEGVLLVTT